jgi:D-beta-D-heptose 7-phosphate kinase/D-beta-D-heptose 1-phosphate adenosyltransferase
MKVWVNGTFDVLHRGHIELLRYSNGWGDVRVGIDSDERIKQLKGENRPVNVFDDRRILLESLKYVNSVVEFGSDQELEDRIKEWGATIMVIGSDYKDKKIIGSHLFEKIIYFDRIENYSSTKIIEHEKNISNR